MSVNNSLCATNFSMASDKNETNDDRSGQNINYYVIDKEVFDMLYTVIICGIIPPITVFGFVGNILALLILTRQKPIRSTTVLLIAIAIADLGFLVVTIINVTQLAIRRFRPEISREVQLKLMIPYTVYFLSLPARISNFLVTAVTLERLVAVTCPLKVRKICTKRFATVLTIVLSLSAAVVLLPRMWLYEVKDVTLPDGNITRIVTLGALGKLTQFFDVYYIISDVVLVYIPIGVMMIANCVIIGVNVVQAKWRRRKSSYVQKLSADTDEYQITKTLLTITCIFIVCIMPSKVICTVVLFDPDSTLYRYSSNVYSLVILIGQVLETINSSVNFVVYVTMGNNYRAAFYSICDWSVNMKESPGTSRPNREGDSRSCSTLASVVNVSDSETHM